jgi:hypothetical protein
VDAFEWFEDFDCSKSPIAKGLLTKASNLQCFSIGVDGSALLYKLGLLLLPLLESINIF